MGSAASIPEAPGGVPFLGHALSLVRDPLGFVSSLAGRGDLVRIRMGPQEVVVVCDPLLTRRLLVDDHTFAKGGPFYDRVRDVVGDSAASPAEHRRQRRLWQPVFHPDRFPGYGAVMAATCEEIARSWGDGQVVDVGAEMMKVSSQTVVRAMFSAALGTDGRAVEDLATLTGGMFRRIVMPPLVNRLPLRVNRDFHRANARLRGTIGALIAERRAAPADRGDLLSAMLSPSGPGGAGEAAAGREPADAEPTDAELTDMVMAVFLAGTETTASALTWALYLLATHRDVEERLHAEVDRVLAGGPVAFAHLPELQVTGHVVTETLRLHPPGWMLTRVTTADTELAGARLPAGTPLACSPHLLHHRPDLHEEPRRFTPERWARERPDRATYIPFGAGARKCVGDRFAVTEAVLALASIASRWRLSPLTDRPPPHSLRHVPSPRGLRMRATARP